MWIVNKIQIIGFKSKSKKQFPKNVFTFVPKWPDVRDAVKYNKQYIMERLPL